VYGPADTKERIDLVLRQVYSEDIRAQNLVRRDAVKVQVANEGIACQAEKWKVTSTHVKHGPNALGYRIDASGKSVAISGDVAEAVEGVGPVRYIAGFPCKNIEHLAKGTDLFIIDACGKHNTPEKLAAAVVRANPRKVVLTHVQNTASAIIYRDKMKKVYEGEVIIAKNLMRIRV
jgi:ribonuclease BN (tRNA processing enzyme)